MMNRCVLLFQLPSGMVQVKYQDGTVLAVDCNSSGVKFIGQDGRTKYYTHNEVVPEEMRRRLEQIPCIVRTLMAANRSNSEKIRHLR